MPDWDQFEAVAEPPTDWTEFEPVIQPTPYQAADIESMTAGRGKAPTGMEAGTELTTAIAEDPERFLQTPLVAIPKIRPKSTLGKILAAPLNVASGLLQGAETPLGALTLPLGGPVAKGVFAGLAAKAAGEQLGEASVTKDPGQIAEGLLGAAVAPAIALHGTLGGKERALADALNRAELTPARDIAPEALRIEGGRIAAPEIFRAEDFEVVEPTPPVPEAKAEPAAPTPPAPTPPTTSVEGGLTFAGMPAKEIGSRSFPDTGTREYDITQGDTTAKIISYTDKIEIQAIRTGEEARGKGSATAVIDQLKQEADRKGIPIIGALGPEVSPEFWKKRGFSVDEEGQIKYPPPPEAKAPTPSDVPAESNVEVIYKAPATGKKSRWIRKDGQWFKAKNLTGTPILEKTPLEPSSLSDALNEQVSNPKPWQRVRLIPTPIPATAAKVTQEVQKVARTEGQRSAKEPWEMTLSQFHEAQANHFIELAKTRLKAAQEHGTENPVYARNILKDWKARLKSGEVDYPTSKTHREAVQKAIEEGKPVPAEVLADYPNLKPPPGTSEGMAAGTKDLASLTAKLESGQPLTKAEKARYLKLRKEATGETTQTKPEVQSGEAMPGPGSPWIGQGPDPYVMGLKTGHPVLNRIQARASNFFKAVKQLVQRRGQKADLSLITNRVDTLPAMEGEQAKRSITLRAPDPYDRRAISVLMQSLKESDPRDYLSQKKADMETAAQAFMQRGHAMDKLQATAAKELAAAYARAVADFDRLLPIAETARARFDRQHARDTAAGLNVAYEEWYVPQRWELDLVKSGNGAVVLADQGGGGGAAFKKAKVFPDFASAVEYSITHPGEYFIPRSLDVADLLGHRVRASEKMLTRQSLFDEFKTVKDPVDRKPIAMDVPRRAIPRPDGTVDYQESVPLGYERREIMPGKPIAIHKGYVRLLDAITGRSQLSESAPIQGLRNLAAVEKHIGLALDTFHASRVLQGGAALGRKVYVGKTLTRALALVEYEKRDLAEAVQRGEITQDMSDYVSKPTEWKIGGRTVRASRSAIVRLLQNNGLNNMRISDAIYKDWIRDIPVIGGVNKWVFDKLTRGVISDIGQIEFDRVSRARPDLNGTQVAREVARNVNAFFGNIGKEGLLKNPSTRTLANIIFLAPNWVLSLATRELLAAKQAAKFPIDLLRGQPTHLGTAARGVGTGLAAYFIGTQILNLFTRGTLTIANPEEGHKLDAWIPDLTGKSDGFFISPMSVFGEVTHDFLKYYRTKNTAHDAALQIVHNKLGNLGRAAYVTATGRDPITDAKLPTTASRAFTAGIQLAPVPITASTPFRAAAQAIAPGTIQKPPPGAIQRQLTASMGFKTEPVPSANTQIRELSKEWMAESTDPKLRHKLEQMQAYDYPSAFRDLRSALRNNDMEMAKAEYRRLLEYHKADAIANSFEHMKPFTGSLATESRFKASLDAEQRQLYRLAVQERKDLNAKFRAMKKGQE